VLLYAPLATLCAYLVGILMGLPPATARLVDDMLSFVANVILSFPVLVLYILIITTIGASGQHRHRGHLRLGAGHHAHRARPGARPAQPRVRLRGADARREPWYIMLVEILPNARGPLIVDACLRLGYVVDHHRHLGFLGLGLPPPDPTGAA
jgi:ABC-type dipeptide/oligopeptide/nickel transport system permease subunit